MSETVQVVFMLGDLPTQQLTEHEYMLLVADMGSSLMTLVRKGAHSDGPVGDTLTHRDVHYLMVSGFNIPWEYCEALGTRTNMEVTSIDEAMKILEPYMPEIRDRGPIVRTGYSIKGGTCEVATQLVAEVYTRHLGSVWAQADLGLTGGAFYKYLFRTTMDSIADALDIPPAIGHRDITRVVEHIRSLPDGADSHERIRALHERIRALECSLSAARELLDMCRSKSHFVHGLLNNKEWYPALVEEEIL